MTFTHKFHSREIKDPHHWLKDQSKQKAQPIMDYLNKENEFYKINMHSHSALIEQIYSETLKKIKEDDDTVPVKKGDYYYFQKTVKNKQYPLHCRSLFGAQETLLDLNTWDYEYISLGHFKISPNHQLLAFSVDLNGSELYSIYFKDLVTGELLSDETILNCAGNIEWFKDNRTVVYNTVDAAHRSDKLWKHELFSGKADSLLLDESDPKFILEPFVSLSGEFILMCSQSSLTTEFHYLPTDSPNSDPVLFLRREYKHRYMLEHQGSGFIIVTDGAGEFLNSRLCHCPLNDTRKEAWVEILPYDPKIQIIDAIPFSNHIVLYECHSKGYKMIRIVSMQNQKAVSNHLIKFQEGLYSVAPSDKSDMDYSSDWFRYEYESFTTAPQIWQYNMESREKTLLKSNAPPGDFDRSLYVTERIHAPIPIETQSDLLGIPKSIPISIVYRKDLFRKDGTNLLYLYGYGSYGISIDPSWRPARFSLLDRGIVFAIAHVRGGGECGRGWYEMGKFKHKKNTFTDFIACADQLVKDNYTRPELMAIDGRSAGGLLIGAVINMRPDIAHVAVLGVPFLDVINTSIIE